MPYFTSLMLQHVHVTFIRNGGCIASTMLQACIAVLQAEMEGMGRDRGDGEGCVFCYLSYLTQ